MHSLQVRLNFPCHFVQSYNTSQVGVFPVTSCRVTTPVRLEFFPAILCRVTPPVRLEGFFPAILCRVTTTIQVIFYVTACRYYTSQVRVIPVTLYSLTTLYQVRFISCHFSAELPNHFFLLN